MKKWLAALLLLLVAGAALASSSDPTIYSDSVANKTDLSIAALSSFFGSVTGVLAGTSGQMFGKLIYQFNQGLLVVAGCWLGFSCIGMVFKSAAHGSFMQQDNKIPLIMLRIALGFGFLIPNPSTGYTMLQGIVMQVAVQGVKLADQIWEYGLDYLGNGGALWSTPPVKNTDNGKSIMTDDDSKAILGVDDEGTNTDNNFSNLGLVQKVMAMEACMVQSSIDRDKENNDGDNNDSNSFVNSASSNDPIAFNENLEKFQYEFPANSDAGNVACGFIGWDQTASSNKDHSTTPTSCVPPSANDPDNPGPDTTQCNVSRLALRELITTTLPVVKRYVCQISGNDSPNVCGDTNEADIASYMTDAMFTSSINWMNLVQPWVRQNIVGTPKALNFINQAKKEGWMVAGRYYWDIMRIEDSYQAAKSASFKDYVPSRIQNLSEIQRKGKPGQTANALLGLTEGPTGYVVAVSKQFQQFGVASAPFAIAPPQVDQDGAGGKILWAVVKTVLGPIGQLFALFAPGNSAIGGLGAEPILWLHHVGMQCLGTGGVIFIGVALFSFLILSTTSVCSSVNSLGYAGKGLLDWMHPLLIACAVGFMVIGISLGFYVPLYPFMIFTFGVIGWIIAVAEAMVAAPLVAFGVTHPDGHDFLGAAKQAVMLLLGVFLRPALMVIGLFTAMILCQVAMGIAVYTFSGIVSDLFASAPNAGAASGNVLGSIGTMAINMTNNMGSNGGLMGIIMTWIVIFPLMLSIFTVFVYTIVTMSFGVIQQFPDYIMLWIGGPQHHGANATQLAEQAKQSISQGVAKATATTGDGLTGSFRGGMADKRADKRAESHGRAGQGIDI